MASALGGDFDGDRKMDDLKLLYRAYVWDALSSGRMEENKVQYNPSFDYMPIFILVFPIKIFIAFPFVFFVAVADSGIKPIEEYIWFR